jgi:formate dehydrogenase maturation protein FdhE
MGCADPDKRSGSKARDNNDRKFFCAVCASEPRRMIVILDTTQRDRIVRLFKCECGELIWDD